MSWNENGQSFWDITNQQRWNWKDRICAAPNPGDSWCICMWATANLIRSVSLNKQINFEKVLGLGWVLKSVNLQYNTLVRWDAGTKDSSTKCLMFQSLFFFIISYRLGALKTLYLYYKKIN